MKLSLKSRALAGSSINAVLYGAALTTLHACAPEHNINPPDYIICDDTTNTQCGNTANVIVEEHE